MALTSLNFGIFLLAAVLVYWSGDFWLKRIFKIKPANDAGAPLAQAWRSGWLAAASIAFLLSWSVQAALTLLIITTANFLMGQILGKEEKRRSLVLWLGIGFNLLALIGLKYAGFYLPAVTALIKALGGQDSGALQILMPIGLSFISVQMISYLIDVYRRQAKPETDWVRFCIYGLYFPKILSGPIERARTFLPRLANPQPLTDQSLARALGLIGVGLVRKVIIANSLYALLPADLFVTPLNYPAQLLALWLAAYSFYLYNDFAGYSALARGVSGLFGIELTQNFNTPFAAQNFSDFWNRWHISLSAWLRDYIYFPLARALRTRIPDSEHKIHVILPPLVTMAVSGLWHGVGWNMLLWGGLHGVYQVVERLLNLNTPRVAPGQQPAKAGMAAAPGAAGGFCLRHAGLDPVSDGVEAGQPLSGRVDLAFQLANARFLLAGADSDRAGTTQRIIGLKPARSAPVPFYWAGFLAG